MGETEFFYLLRKYFPVIYDLKVLQRSISSVCVADKVSEEDKDIEAKGKGKEKGSKEKGKKKEVPWAGWGGLQTLADALGVVRVGSSHQAGSDSLLTGDAFFKLRAQYFEELIDEKKYLNTLYGLGTSELARAHDTWYFH